MLTALACTFLLTWAGLAMVLRLLHRAAFWLTPVTLLLAAWLCKIAVVTFLA